MEQVLLILLIFSILLNTYSVYKYITFNNVRKIKTSDNILNVLNNYNKTLNETNLISIVSNCFDSKQYEVNKISLNKKTIDVAIKTGEKKYLPIYCYNPKYNDIRGYINNIYNNYLTDNNSEDCAIIYVSSLDDYIKLISKDTDTREYASSKNITIVHSTALKYLLDEIKLQTDTVNKLSYVVLNKSKKVDNKICRVSSKNDLELNKGDNVIDEGTY